MTPTNTGTVDFQLLLDPYKLLDRPGRLLYAKLRLPGTRQQQGSMEVPIMLDIEYTDDQKVQLSGFVLQSVAAFTDRYDEIVRLVASETRAESEALGVSPAEAGTITGIHFGHKQVPSDANVKKMKELLYPELSEDQIRALHDRPDTQSRFDVEATVSWDDEHIRLFRFRDGQCYERAAT